MCFIYQNPDSQVQQHQKLNQLKKSLNGHNYTVVIFTSSFAVQCLLPIRLVIVTPTHSSQSVVDKTSFDKGC